MDILLHYIVPATVLLGILIFVHECGHFIVAKIAGVRVLKFSLGFGPKIIGKKIGDTEYMLSLLPLGGYVKPLGESPDEPVEEADRPYSLTHQSIPKRFAVLVAGSLFNILFATVLFTAIYIAGTPMLVPRIGAVMEESPAYRAGLQPGDRITAINDHGIELWDELSAMVSSSGGKEMTFTILRGDQALTVSITPEQAVAKDLFGEEQPTYRIGISAATDEDAFVTKRYNPATAVFKGCYDTGKWCVLTLKGLWVLAQSPIERKNEIGGPILIGKLAGDFAQVGPLSFLLLMALISVNLGVLNLLPIPILDGGHIFFLIIEAVKGSPLSMKKMEIAQQIGLALLLLIMVLVFYNDITRFIPR